MLAFFVKNLFRQEWGELEESDGKYEDSPHPSSEGLHEVEGRRDDGR